MAAEALRVPNSTPKVRQRYRPPPGDWDPNLPYGGKVYLPRRKKRDPLWIKIGEGLLIVFTVWLCYYSYFYFDNLHFHITHAYAHLGLADAQHQVGHRYLQGRGVDKHVDSAMHWFKKAADQGHPSASYNLAVGHLKGYKSGLKSGEARKLMHHAAFHGVKEAQQALDDVCAKGGCDK